MPNVVLALLASLAIAQGAPAEWTILYYGHGDNNLTDELVGAVEEMGQASLKRSVNLLVAADYCAGNVCSKPGPDVAKDPIHGKPVASGTQFIRIQGDGAPPVLVQSVPEQNFDDPAVLRQWVARAFREFPARRHAVILFDHGGSWSGGFGGDEQDGTVKETRGMAASEVAAALRDGMRDAGLPDGARLDFVAFHACLMATIEVMWEFRDVARVFIANAEIDATGPDLVKTFSWLASAPGATTQQVAVMDVGDWDEMHASAQRPFEELLRARAAFDMDRLPQHQSDMKALVETMLRSRALGWSEVARSRALAGPQYGRTNEMLNSDLFDAGHFLKLLAQTRSDPTVAVAAGKAARSLRDMTLQTSLGSVRAAAGQSGLHTAMNHGDTWNEETREEYGRLAWNRAVGWSRVLDALEAGGHDRPPEFTASARRAPGPGVARLEVTPTSDDVVEVLAYVVRPDAAGALQRHGAVWKEQATAGSTAAFVWDGKVLTFVGADGKSAPVNAEPLVYVSGQEPPLHRVLLYLVDGKGNYLKDDAGGRREVFGLVDSSHRLMSFLLLDDGVWKIMMLDEFEGYSMVPVLPSVERGDARLGRPMKFDGDVPPTTKLQAVKGPYQFEVIVRDIWGNESSRLVPAP